jgi:hypothetical protein
MIIVERPGSAKGKVERKRDLRLTEPRDLLAADTVILGVLAHDLGADRLQIMTTPSYGSWF